MTSKPRLLYMHIPKTGGSTMRVIAERQYPKSSRLNINEGTLEANHKVLQDMSQDQRDSLTCVIGHLEFGIHHLFPTGENAYMIMLRHPVKRMMSNYYFTRSKPFHRHHDWVKNQSLLEYSQFEGVQSLATRFIAGMSGTTPDTLEVVHTVDDTSLERAKANLRDHYKVIGFTEEFDASLLMMKKPLGWGNLYYYAINTSEQFKKKEPREKMTPELTAALEEACKLDMALYRYALELYEAQKDAYGRDKLTRDLEAFQHMNRRISPLLGFAHRLRNNRFTNAARRRLKP